MGSIPTERFARCTAAKIAAAPSFYNVSRPITLKTDPSSNPRRPANP